MLAKEFLPDIAEPSRDRRLDIYSDLRSFLTGHGAPSRERESLRVPLISKTLNRTAQAENST
jgi:hypothetical protein